MVINIDGMTGIYAKNFDKDTDYSANNYANAIKHGRNSAHNYSVFQVNRKKSKTEILNSINKDSDTMANSSEKIDAYYNFRNPIDKEISEQTNPLFEKAKLIKDNQILTQEEKNQQMAILNNQLNETIETIIAPHKDELDRLEKEMNTAMAVPLEATTIPAEEETSTIIRYSPELLKSTMTNDEYNNIIIQAGLGYADEALKNEFGSNSISTAQMGYYLLGIEENGSADTAAENIFRNLQLYQSGDKLWADMDKDGDADDDDKAIIKTKLESNGTDGIIDSDEAAAVGAMYDVEEDGYVGIDDFYADMGVIDVNSQNAFDGAVLESAGISQSICRIAEAIQSPYYLEENTATVKEKAKQFFDLHYLSTKAVNFINLQSA